MRCTRHTLPNDYGSLGVRDGCSVSWLSDEDDFADQREVSVSTCSNTVEASRICHRFGSADDGVGKGVGNPRETDLSV